MPGIEVVTTSDRPDLSEQAGAAFRPGWPSFIFHDPVSAAFIPRVERYFPGYDVLVLEDGAVVAGGWGVPLAWDATAADLPDGYDGSLVRAVEGHERNEPPDTLSVLAAAVRPDRQGAGLAGRVLTALRERATRAGLSRVVVPVRPTLKAQYPLTPMVSFAGWKRGDGRHLDPWIRTHQRLGATVLGVAHRSMMITGSVAEWETWTGMAFPESGSYVVTGALGLVDLDRESDRGTYVEENLWMRHL